MSAITFFRFSQSKKCTGQVSQRNSRSSFQLFKASRFSRQPRMTQKAFTGPGSLQISNTLQSFDKSASSPDNLDLVNLTTPIITDSRITPLKGVSFSTSRFLLSFYLGVMEVLKHERLMVRGATEVSGTGGGGVAACLFSCGVPVDEAIVGIKAMHRVLSDQPDIEVQYVLEATLNEMLPANAHEVMSVLPAAVSVTRVWPPPFPLLVSRFSSKQDLLGALVAGCYEGGGNMGKAPFKKWREWECYDGGSLSSQNHMQPPLECGMSADTISVSTFPKAVQENYPGFQGVSDIYPDLGDEWSRDESWAFMLKDIGRNHLGGYQDILDDIDALRDLGQLTALEWLESYRRASPTLQSDGVPGFVSPMVESTDR